VEIPKPSTEDFAWFRSIVPDDPRVRIKKMFGNEAAFVNDVMFAGLFGADVGVRLAADDADKLRGEGGGPFGEHTLTLPPKKKPAQKKPAQKKPAQPKRA
jgi:hypothetical protein